MDEFLPPFSEDCRRQHRAQRASVLKAFWSKVIVTLPIGEGGYNPGTKREGDRADRNACRVQYLRVTTKEQKG